MSSGKEPAGFLREKFKKDHCVIQKIFLYISLKRVHMSITIHFKSANMPHLAEDP